MAYLGNSWTGKSFGNRNFQSMLYTCFPDVSCFQPGDFTGQQIMMAFYKWKQLKGSYSFLWGHRTSLLSVKFHYHTQAPMGRGMPTRLPLATLVTEHGSRMKVLKVPKVPGSPGMSRPIPVTNFSKLTKWYQEPVIQSFILWSFLIAQWCQQKKKRNKEKNTLVCLPFVGPYHVVSKFMVSLDHLQGDHKVDVGIGVPQLVEFNIDWEEVIPHVIDAHLQALAHHIPGRRYPVTPLSKGFPHFSLPQSPCWVMKLLSRHKEQHSLCVAKFTSNPFFLCWAVFLLSMAVVPNCPVPGWLHHSHLGSLLS